LNFTLTANALTLPLLEYMWSFELARHMFGMVLGNPHRFRRSLQVELPLLSAEVWVGAMGEITYAKWRIEFRRLKV